MREATSGGQADGRYCGRFAPSPTGPLHFGSLVAAVASYLDARSQGGRWLLRMEDIDTPRCTAHAAAAILRSLDCFGFEPDGEVVWQSRRLQRYGEAVHRLRLQGDVFACACTRKELADSQLAPDGATIYPGSCRHGLPPGREARAWRVAVTGARVSFIDRLQGVCDSDLAKESGDFVVQRADGLFAYQLAVVVDDADAGVTDVVRGADLLVSTPRQIWLQQRLGLPTPNYAHVPVVVSAGGEKLSKQTLAAPLDDAHPVPSLVAALHFLGQSPPAMLSRASLSELWAWAQAHWQFGQIPHQRSAVMGKF